MQYVSALKCPQLLFIQRQNSSFHDEEAGAGIGHIGDLLREQIKMGYAKVVQNSGFFFFFINMIFEPRCSLFLECGTVCWLLSVCTSVSFAACFFMLSADSAGYRLLIRAYFNGLGDAGWLLL